MWVNKICMCAIVLVTRTTEWYKLSSATQTKYRTGQQNSPIYLPYSNGAHHWILIVQIYKIYKTQMWCIYMYISLTMKIMSLLLLLFLTLVHVSAVQAKV